MANVYPHCSQSKPESNFRLAPGAHIIGIVADAASRTRARNATLGPPATGLLVTPWLKPKHLRSPGILAVWHREISRGISYQTENKTPHVKGRETARSRSASVVGSSGRECNIYWYSLAKSPCRHC